MTLFEEILGQAIPARMLSSHIKSDLLSHAYIFVGKEGSGKEFFARAFARYILCGNKKEDNCSGCQKFKKGIHPDFYLIDGADGIKIEQVRLVIEKLALTPVISGSNVLLILQADNMGIEASNAILKTLEEPPGNSVILMTASSKKRLPETVVSRSQVARVNKLKINEVRDIASREYKSKDIEEALELSGTKIGKALELLQDANLFDEQKKLYGDAFFLISGTDILKKFKIIEFYEKNKKTREIMLAIKDITEKELNRKGAGEPSVDRQSLFFFAKKILKMHHNLRYNINLRIALEEMVLENELNV